MALVVGVALVRAGRILAARRSYPAHAAGRWEFPGGKVEDGESPEETAVREVAEELGCRVRVLDWLAPSVEIRPGLELRVARAELVTGEPVPRPGEHDAIRWLAVDDLGSVDWLEADRPFVAALAAGTVGGTA